MKVWQLAYAVPLAGITGLATVLMLGAAPALATDTTVNIMANIDTDVTIGVNEDIFLTKVINLTATVNDTATKFAEANADATQVNTDDNACENCAERSDTLNDSVNGNSGITTTNQAGGNFNNQGAEVSAAVDNSSSSSSSSSSSGGSSSGGFAESTASATQQNVGDLIEVLNIVFRDALIENSVVGDKGITLVNQSVGNINNQLNEVSIALSKQADGVALSEADLGQFNTGTSETPELVGENNVAKTATINTGSISGNAGIVGVNQESGNFGNQANLVSFSAVQP